MDYRIRFGYQLPVVLILCAFFSACSKGQKAEQPWQMHIIDNSSSGADGNKLADVEGDGDLDIITGWEQGGLARIYFNPGQEAHAWPFVEVPAPNVEDALPMDIDNDGAYDLVTCSEGEYMRVSFHWGPSDAQQYLKSEYWKTEDVPVTLGRTRWMFAEVMDIDGRNGLDIVLGSKDPRATLGWLEAPEHPRDIAAWQYHEISPANWIMSIKIVDIDKDGAKDILVSDRAGPNRGVRWLKNPGLNSPDLRNRWKSIPVGMMADDPLFLDLADENRDGLLEIWAPNLRDYFMYFQQKDSSGKRWDSLRWPIPPMAGLIGKSAAFGDIDLDGKLDLITTYDGAEDRAGVVWSSYEEDKTTWTHHDVSGLEGIKYDYATLLDMDRDGDLDILTCEEANNSQQGPGLGVIWYENPTRN